MPVNGRSWGFNVSEGLEPPSWWYIPESGIHHQPKVTRQGPPGSASRRRIAAAPPGPHDQSERLTCGNDDRGQPESSCRPGPDGGIRTAALHHLAGMVTASRCCPEVPAPQPQPLRTSPDDLAAELNPHKTELNPHKAVEAAVGPGRMGAGRQPACAAARLRVAGLGCPVRKRLPKLWFPAICEHRRIPQAQAGDDQHPDNTDKTAFPGTRRPGCCISSLTTINAGELGCLPVRMVGAGVIGLLTARRVRRADREPSAPPLTAAMPEARDGGRRPGSRSPARSRSPGRRGEQPPRRRMPGS